MRLQGKVALVTGAAKRVGRVVSLALAQRGARIAIHYNRSRTDAQRLAGEIKDSTGREAALFQADLSDVRAVQRLAQAVLRRFGKVHVLVNNASTYEKNEFGGTGRADWDGHLDVNLRAPFF
ncbi:MAG: SDR family NAD(P)-dependent oxidoreductase, partial [Elusimicrobia bacterium]|nr:SDR family NAD(P)-dependent oxidoreductase [Elusimicrobiota bacterium]